MMALFSGLVQNNAGGAVLRPVRLFGSICCTRGASCWCAARQKCWGCKNFFVESGPGHFIAVALASFALAFCAQWAAARLTPARVPATARAWREVDLAALRHNAQVLMEALGGCSLMAVLKADAYGHGAGKVAKALRRCGVRAFAVATVAEGVALRRAFVRGENSGFGLYPARTGLSAAPLAPEPGRGG